MAIDVPMPKLGLTMEEAMIIEWLVPDGATVLADEPIMMIETDKTETEVGAPGSGRLHQIGKPGDVFRCGVLVGLLLADGEQPQTPAQTPAAASPLPSATPAAAAGTAPASPAAHTQVVLAPIPTDATSRVVASPYARAIAAERGVRLHGVQGTGPGGRIVAADVPATASPVPLAVPAAAALGAQVVASFAARNLADLLGVDLAAVPVDPTEQRVTRDGVALHVRRLLQSLSTPPAPAVPAPTPLAPLLQEPTSMVRLSGMRGTIAKRMHASLQQMAQLTLSMDADMGAVLADRAARKALGSAPTITDYIVAATARALVGHPGLNAQVTADGIALLPQVHVGLAVAVPGGLIVPVIRDTAERDLADLATETTRLASAARAGALTPAELEGGTFSVSALGAFGVDMFTPVINPPNAGILGVGRLRDDLALIDGEVTTVPRLTLSLTWDHRVVDGVPAAEFCRTIVALLADPTALAG